MERSFEGIKFLEGKPHPSYNKKRWKLNSLNHWLLSLLYPPRPGIEFYLTGCYKSVRLVDLVYLVKFVWFFGFI